MTSPGTSPQDLQLHLYQSFLEGKTTDVALRISGSWHAVYHLHRVVLIQSGFFRSLFTAGFAESAPPRSPGRLSTPEELDVVFDDMNITRAAFEVCISRLYGGGPELHVCPKMKPTLSHPLTPGFPHFVEDPVPEGQQPATPQFLASLLATSIYLSVPSVASQALSAIYGTFGPYTVLHYLHFALGQSIVRNDPDSTSHKSAVGLESVADIRDSASDSDEDVVGPSLSRYEECRSPSPDVISASPNGSFERVSSSAGDAVSYDSLSFHYGAVSDKIGEAASAWLARWGPDLLVYEEQMVQGDILNSHSSIIKQRKRAKTIPVGQDTCEEAHTTIFNRSTANIPLIWRKGGLSPLWIKALISSDSFFVKNEHARYNVAKRVVDLRRSESGIDEAEEKVWEELFSQGIYYCNMVPDEIIAISHDICSATKKPYVPLSVLQSSNWTHTLLRHQILARPVSPGACTTSTGSGSPQFENLGLATPRNDSTSSGIPHFRIPTDETMRIGERGGPSSEGKGVSMEQLFAHSHSTSSHSSTSMDALPDNSPVTFSEKTFFGLVPAPSKSPNATYSSFPPFRFGVEFFDVDHLKVDRLHSQTIWYAGSLFNVYLQVVKKKGSISGPHIPGASQPQQIGIYVSRQSTVENLPDFSSMNPMVAHRTMEMHTGIIPPHNVRNGVLATPMMQHHHILHLPATSSTLSTPGTGTRSTTPLSESRPGTSSSLPSSSSFPTPSYRDALGFPYSLPYRAPSVVPVQPYRDSRPNVMAYFMVYAASPTGTSQTRFMSGPDQFKVGGSWGWKSSSLKENDIPPGEGDPDTQASKVSLRATVIIGVV